VSLKNATNSCWRLRTRLAGGSERTRRLIRDFLKPGHWALAGLENAYASRSRSGGYTVSRGRRPYAAFHGSAGSRRAGFVAAVELVLAQPAISSQSDRQSERVHSPARSFDDLFPYRRDSQGEPEPGDPAGATLRDRANFDSRHTQTGTCRSMLGRLAKVNRAPSNLHAPRRDLASRRPTPSGTFDIYLCSWRGTGYEFTRPSRLQNDR